MHRAEELRSYQTEINPADVNPARGKAELGGVENFFEIALPSAPNVTSPPLPQRNPLRRETRWRGEQRNAMEKGFHGLDGWALSPIEAGLRPKR